MKLRTERPWQILYYISYSGFMGFNSTAWSRLLLTFLFPITFYWDWIKYICTRFSGTHRQWRSRGHVVFRAPLTQSCLVSHQHRPTCQICWTKVQSRIWILSKYFYPHISPNPTVHNQITEPSYFNDNIILCSKNIISINASKKIQRMPLLTREALVLPVCGTIVIHLCCLTAVLCYCVYTSLVLQLNVPLNVGSIFTSVILLMVWSCFGRTLAPSRPDRKSTLHVAVCSSANSNKRLHGGLTVAGQTLVLVSASFHFLILSNSIHIGYLHISLSQSKRCLSLSDLLVKNVVILTRLTVIKL